MAEFIEIVSLSSEDGSEHPRIVNLDEIAEIVPAGPAYDRKSVSKIIWRDRNRAHTHIKPHYETMSAMLVSR
jgi:hypothetical protein